MMLFEALAAVVLAAAAPAPVSPPEARTYAEGQVWEYRTRPGEKRSLLRIQKIEIPPEDPARRPVYHISIIGLKLAANVAGVLQHVPVSRETLDSSVTRLSRKRPTFPDVGPGIAEWRRAQGGVFTVTVAEITEMLDRSTRAMPAD
jgi:hypothetical protein